MIVDYSIFHSAKFDQRRRPGRGTGAGPGDLCSDRPRPVTETRDNGSPQIKLRCSVEETMGSILHHPNVGQHGHESVAAAAALATLAPGPGRDGLY
jgi:hypothetical protein